MLRISLISLITCSLFCLIGPSLFAEGTKEVAPNANIVVDGNSTTDVAALLIGHTEYNQFATYSNNDPNSRLYIHINDPSSECIYLGLSVGHLNQTTTTPSAVSYEYRIKDPDGNIVYGPVLVNPGDENISNWTEAYNGPMGLVGSSGYNQVTVSNADLMSGGWNTAGDYYIEFQNMTSSTEFLIDFWDFSVVDCQTTVPTYKPGRIWSFNWAFFAINDYGFPNRPFNGSFHVCAPDPDDADRAFITKIDFDQSGFQPAAFNVAFNSFGSQNTGVVSVDRRSRESINSTQSEYAIFLNDPVDLCETALSGEVTLLGLSRCNDSDYCIKFSTTKEGQVDLLLDFDGNDNVYTPGTADVQVSQTVLAADVGIPTCINWDGLDGLGQPLDENTATTIPVTIAFAQGIYHFPIYDAEIMSNGFNISAVRPAGSTPLLYYDDSDISVPSGSGESNIQLTGCTLPCHRWTNYTGGSVVGFGNLNTINSWWFSQLLIEQELIFLPAYYACDILGADTLCENMVDTLKLDLAALPAGITNPTITGIEWFGPGIIGATNGTQIVIDQSGNYQVNIIWTNNLGDECRTACSKSVIFDANCCSVAMQCGLDSTWYNCDEILPPPASTPQDLIDAGLLEVMDASCASLRMTVDIIVNTADCQTAPKTTIYSYTVWDDIDGNGQSNGQEQEVSCQQVYLTRDMTPPSLEFTGDLAGMQSGDTLYIQCQAADPNWSMPMPSVDDISVNDDCSEVNVEMSDEVFDGDCMADGYIKSFRCSWLAVDDCGNENELFIYMLLVDKLAPTISDVADDITLTCHEIIPEPYSTAIDECNCAHLSMKMDTIYFNCPSEYAFNRIYTWTDHCGNSASEEQLITIKDIQPLDITLPNGYSNGQEIEINCAGGAFPIWLSEFNKTSIQVNSGCNSSTSEFEFTQVESNDCSAGYLSKYKLNWAVTDDCGRSNNAHIIAKIIDREAPVIVAYPEVYCDGTFDASSLIAEDNCGITQIIHEEIVLSASCQNAYDLKHTWNIYDQCGNMTYGELIVRVGDTIPPSLALAAPYQSLTFGSSIMIDCKTDITHFTNELSINVENDCGTSDISKEVELVEESNCILNHIGLYQIKWDVKDDCGNSSSFVVFVHVSAPDISNLIPDDVLQMECGEEIPELEIDACIERIELLDERLQSQCNSERSYRAYTITGVCGGVVRDTLWMEFVDDEAPVFNDIPDEICTLNDLPSVIAWDECEQRFVPVNIYHRTEDICGLKLNVISFSATDRCGNETHKAVTVILGLLEQEYSIFYDQQEILSGIGGWPIISASCPFELDESKFSMEPNCPVLDFDISYELLSGDCSNSEFYEQRFYTIGLTSICGLQKKVHLNVFIRDQSAPLFIDPLADVTISCIDTFEFPDIETWDNCSEVTVSKEQVTLVGLPGLTQVMQTWTAQDACGNESVHERIVSQYAVPTCEIIVPDNIRCHSTITLSNLDGPAAEPLTYEWHISQGDCMITSDNQSSPQIDVVMFSDTAVVTLIVTDVFGCQSECDVTLHCTDKIETPIALSSTTNLSNVNAQVFPNPFNDVLNYQHEELINEIIIRNTQGQLIQILSPNNKNGSIELTNLVSGLYFIELNDARGERAVFRMLKM